MEKGAAFCSSVEIFLTQILDMDGQFIRNESSLMAANILQNTLDMLLEARMSRSRGELLCSSHRLDSGPSSHGKYFIILLVFTVDLSLDPGRF